MNAAYWISKLGLEPHPEGGYYRRFYESKELHQCEDGRGVRPIMTAIWYLQIKGECSKLHRLKSDEIWFYHSGNPIQVVILEDHKSPENIIVGTSDKQGQLPTILIPKGKMFLSFATMGDYDYSLVSCSVSPGFHFDDFEILDDEEQSESSQTNEEMYEFDSEDFDNNGKNHQNKYFDDLIYECEMDFAKKHKPYFANYFIGNYSVMNLLKVSLQLDEHEDLGTLQSEDFELSLILDEHSERQTVYAIGSRVQENIENPLFLIINPNMPNGEVILRYISDDDDENDSETNPITPKQSQKKVYTLNTTS